MEVCCIFQPVSLNSKSIATVLLMGYDLISNDLSSAECLGVLCLNLHEKALRSLLDRVISSSIPWLG